MMSLPLSSAISLPAFLLLVLTSTILLLGREWRWMILALAVQYIGVFLLVALSWPFEIAVVKLVAGWMAGAVLGVAVSNAPANLFVDEHLSSSGSVFRLLAALLAGLTVISLAGSMQELVGASEQEQVLGGLVLVGMGLLHLGLTSQPLRVILGLLTVLAGFEILYSIVESATLVAGLLALATIGIAVVGAYLLAAPGLEEE